MGTTPAEKRVIYLIRRYRDIEIYLTGTDRDSDDLDTMGEIEEEILELKDDVDEDFRVRIIDNFFNSI